VSSDLSGVPGPGEMTTLSNAREGPTRSGFSSSQDIWSLKMITGGAVPTSERMCIKALHTQTSLCQQLLVPRSASKASFAREGQSRKITH
jgi:hypothetical protein